MLYQPFWTIFEYRALASGESRVGLLLRLYYQVWGSDYLHIKIPLLLSYSRDKDELTNVSFLLSMFGYTRDVRGARLRLFWIPVTLWKTESPVENAREANTPEAYNRGRGAFGEAELFQALSCGISFLPVEYYPGLLGTFPRFSGSYLREAGEDGFVTMDYLNYSKRVF
jgi:hypothetical protein